MDNLIQLMDRKVYKAPAIDVLFHNLQVFLSASDGTGVTIPDAGWGDAKYPPIIGDLWDDEGE